MAWLSTIVGGYKDYLGQDLAKCPVWPHFIYVTNFIQTITPGILDQFQQSKWPPKALKKTFLTVPKMSQSDQYSPSY